MAQISIIVPVYKVEKYLNRCVDSILSQTFTDFELILVDDGSPDNCGKICDEYAEKDKRVVVIHKENGGVSEARNVAIEYALANSDSEWITFIDSDDWVHPGYLENLYNAATKYNVDVSICYYQETNGTAEPSVCESSEAALWKPEDFFVKHRVDAIVPWAKLYKKECFREIRYPVGKRREDEFVTYRILFELPEVAVANAQLYYYFQNESGFMKSESQLKRNEELNAYEEQLEYFEANQFMMAKMCVARSCAGCFCAELNEADLNGYTAEDKKRLLCELRKTLKKYRREIPIDECRWAYAVAYPKKTKFCDIVQRIFRLFKR